MKLMKAMKKLNFWSRKKRKKNNYNHHYQKLPHYDFQPCYDPPPPPPRPPPPRPREFCPCHFCRPAEPSAPPLPPWLEVRQEGDHSGFAFADAIIEEEIVDQCVDTSREVRQQGDHSDFTFADDIIEQEIDDDSVSIYQEVVVTTTASPTTTTATTTNTRDRPLQEAVVNTADASADADTGSFSSSLQQYSSNKEIVVAANAAAAAASSGVFGCVVDVGGLLFRCFFPCFHITEPRSYRVSREALHDHNILKKTL